MNEYRCTRNAPYMHECFGHKDLSARQGYYIQSKSETEAHLIMAEQFPFEIEQGFTVKLWRENI